MCHGLYTETVALDVAGAMISLAGDHWNWMRLDGRLQVSCLPVNCRLFDCYYFVVGYCAIAVGPKWGDSS